MIIRACVRCENLISEGEATAELEGVTYHVPCLIADLVEQIAELERKLAEYEGDESCTGK